MNSKLKLLSLAMGAISSLQMFSPLAAHAADPKEQNENNVASETTENLSIPGVDEQNVNQLNEDGYAPLHLQIVEDNLEKIIFLVSLGADISIKDKNGDTPLHTAAREDSIECLSYLISKGADVEAKNSQGETPLMLAAKEGNRLAFFALLGEWLKERKANINAVDDNNNTVLHCLAGSDMDDLISHLSKIEYLSEKKDNFLQLCKMVNRRNNDGETPVFNAIRSKNEDVAMLLIKNGALHISNDDGQTPLMLAAQDGLKNLVRKFVELDVNIADKDNAGNTLLHYMAHDWDSSLNEVFIDPDDVKSDDKPFLQLRKMVNISNAYGATPLFVTAENNQLELAEILIKNGADVFFKDITGSTPLHNASSFNSFDVARVLISYGANVNERNANGETPLHRAAFLSDIKFINLLIDSGAMETINSLSNLNNTPLELALIANKLDVMEFLISKGADVNQLGFEEKSLLNTAIERGNIDAVRLLIEFGADVNVTNNKGETPLFVTAENNQLELAEILIKNGAILESKNYFSATPLCKAVEKNSFEVAKLLIENGADLEAKLENGFTPITLAALQNNFELAKLLIENGANINYEHEPLLSLAANDINLVRLLVSMGADVNQKDLHKGYTAICSAVGAENKEVVEFLIKNGANLNVISSETFYSPLRFAVQRKNLDIAQILIKNGADVNMIHGDEGTLLHIAVKNGNVDVVRFLIESGADVNVKDFKGQTPLDLATDSQIRSLLEEAISK